MTENPQDKNQCSSQGHSTGLGQGCGCHGTEPQSKCCHAPKYSITHPEKAGDSCCSSEKKECKCFLKSFFKWLFGGKPSTSSGQDHSTSSGCGTLSEANAESKCCRSHTDEKAAAGQCCRQTLSDEPKGKDKKPENKSEGSCGCGDKN